MFSKLINGERQGGAERVRRWTFAGVLGALILNLAIPGSAQDQDKEEKKGGSGGGRTAYVRRLFEKDRATFGDACRMVLSLVERKPVSGSFAEIQKDLDTRGILVGSWAIKESSPVDRGTLAYMLCKSLGIKGGLTIRLFGLSRRYALRECISIGLMNRGSAEKYVKGRMLIDVITDAGIYQREGNLNSVRR